MAKKKKKKKQKQNTVTPPRTLEQIQKMYRKPKMTADKEDLLKYAKQLAEYADRRYERMGAADTISMKTYHRRLEQLDALDENYRTRINADMSKKDIQQTIKAMEAFLGSASSTKTGYKNIPNEQLKGIEDAYSVTPEEAEAILESMKQLSKKSQEQGVSISDLYAMAYEVYEDHGDFDDYVEMVKEHLGKVDEELQRQLESIWDVVTRR